MKRSFSGMGWIVVGAALLLAVVLVVDAVPGLRGGFGWRWPYALPEDMLRALPLLLAVIVYLGGGFLLLRRGGAPGRCCCGR